MHSQAQPLAGAVIAFDLDGTLVDTAPDLIGTLNAVLEAEGHAALAMDEARPFIGRGARWLLERGFAAAGAPLAPERTGVLFEAFIARYLARIADESRPFPGLEAALSDLRRDGARLCVCTNKRSDLSEALLAALGLSTWFDAVIGSDRTPAIKPDGRHLVTAIEALGGRPERAIMVGDAATDAGAARAAGAHLVLVSFGYTETPVAELQPDALIDHFDQLPAACRRLLDACGGQAERL